MENKDRIIRLSDLFALLLKSFVFIVGIAIVFAVFGAARSARSQEEVNRESNNVTHNQLERSRKEFEEAQFALSTSEASLKNIEEVQIPALVERIAWAKTNIIHLKNHLDNSLLMALDPYSCSEASKSFYLEAHQLPVIIFQENKSYVLTDEELEGISTYRTLWPLDTEMLERVRSILGVEADLLYIREIATIAYDPMTGLTEIKVCYSDTSAAQKAVDYLFSAMKKQLDNTVGVYKITSLGNFCGTIVDLNVKNDQIVLMEGLTNLAQELSNSEKSLSELRESISDKKKEIDAASSTYSSAKRSLDEMERIMSSPNATAGISRRAMLRNAVIAGLFGAVFGCIVVICEGLFGKRLQNHSELSWRYSFPLLGVLPRQKKYLFERLIRRLEGEGNYSFDAAAQAAAQSILSAVGEKTACLASSLGRDEAERILPYLDGRLKCCGDILGEADAVKALADYDGVVLVEKREKSNIDLIDSEVQRIHALGKEIIGIVLT